MIVEGLPKSSQAERLSAIAAAASAVAAAAAVFLAVQNVGYAGAAYEEAAFYDAVNLRIGTCVELATHYYQPTINLRDAGDAASSLARNLLLEARATSVYNVQTLKAVMEAAEARQTSKLEGDLGPYAC